MNMKKMQDIDLQNYIALIKIGNHIYFNIRFLDVKSELALLTHSLLALKIPKHNLV